MSEPMGAGADALTMLMHDHRQVEHLYDQLQSAGAAGRTDDQKQIGERIIAELSVHATVEEQFCTRPPATPWLTGTAWWTRASTSIRR